MPLDPRIAMGFQSPQFESPVNMMGNMMKLKSMQQQNALAEQQMADLATQRNRAAALDAAYQGAYNPETGEINYNAIAGKLAQGGQGSAIPSLMKTRDEAAKARYEQLDARGKALVQEGNVFQSQLQQVDPSDPNAPSLMAKFILGHHAPGSITAELLKAQGITPEQSLAALDNAVKTGTFEDFLKRSQLGATEFIKANAPKFTQVDAGGYNFTQQIPGLGGAATRVPGSITQKTLSPDEQSRINRELDPEKVAHVATDENGNIRFFNARGGEVNLGAGRGAGKPSAVVTTSRIKSEQLRKDLQSTVGELERIVKPGGLLDVSTGSGAGALVDRAAEFVGSSTEGAQAISRLKPIADMVLKLVPRFEGPQSDADTKSYRDAAGDLANPSLPREQRKAAAQTILRLFKQRQGQFGTTDADGNVVTSGAAPSTSGGSDIDALVDKHRTK